MRSSILRDFPEAFETERLWIRSPLPGDGAEVYAAVVESLEELKPWMPWARREFTVEEENMRRARAAFLERSDLMLLLFLKGTGTLVGGSGLHRIN